MESKESIGDSYRYYGAASTQSFHQNIEIEQCFTTQGWFTTDLGMHTIYKKRSTKAIKRILRFSGVWTGIVQY